MNRSWTIALTVTALAGLGTGCATYTPPPEGAPYAEITLQLGGGATTLQSVKDASCSDGLTAPQIAQVGQLGGYTGNSSRIATDKRMFLRAGTVVGWGNRMDVCSSISSFVPIAGHRYGVMQTATSARSCQMKVVDFTTGGRPETLIEHGICQ